MFQTLDLLPVRSPPEWKRSLIMFVANLRQHPELHTVLQYCLAKIIEIQLGKWPCGAPSLRWRSNTHLSHFYIHPVLFFILPAFSLIPFQVWPITYTIGATYSGTLIYQCAHLWVMGRNQRNPDGQSTNSTLTGPEVRIEHQSLVLWSTN